MIISQFYPHIGGAEQQALNLAKALTGKGIPVSVLTRRILGLKAHEEIQGIPVYRSIRVLDRGKWFGITYMIMVFWFLFRMRHSYDIIHCHLVHGVHSPVALTFKALFKKKVIIKVAGTGPISDLKMLRELMFGNSFLRQLKQADRVITVCHQATREAQKLGIPISSIAQIPNGVDTRHFRPSPNHEKNNEITFIGRLDYMKGIHILLEAFKILKRRGVNAQLRIIGDGPDREKLEGMAEDLSISGSVTFSGEIKDVVVPLQESAVFVLPSLSEGLSNVLLEAMACGLPIVATRIGGNIDLIKDGVNGILVDPERPDQLSNALRKILRDNDLARCMGIEARKTVEEQFSMDSVVKRYVELYKELVMD
jgi:glycosyltransferase involved in cell wall biosynthesis